MKFMRLTQRFTSEFDQVHQPVEQEIVEQQPIEQYSTTTASGGAKSTTRPCD